jgi:hypothetical protein
MLCSQLSTIRSLVNDEQFHNIIKYFESLWPNSKITASNFASQIGIEFPLSQKILQELVKTELLTYILGIRCPECGFLLSSTESIASIEKEQYCYNCSEEIEISTDDIEVIYTFKNYPFAHGQQSDSPLAIDKSAALQYDSLSQLLKSGLLDINAAFFAPTDEEYHNLQIAYKNIFNAHPTTKAKGDTLENLTINLFNLCKHFRANGIRLNVNQIDCYVRNTLYIPGISQAGCVDSFVIECKNEKSTPKAGYMNKLHSILHNSGKNFGIIVSKCSAPRTFVSLANQIYLRDDIIIISLDKEDLTEIVFKKSNLLECISRKIDAVKLNATKDLIALGLYNA